MSIAKCPEFLALSNNEATASQGCDTCDNMYHKIGSMYPVISKNVFVDIGKCYDYLVSSKKLKTKCNVPQLVAGDLDKYGFAVYTGMEYSGNRNTQNLSDIYQEVHDLIHLAPQNRWRNVNSRRFTAICHDEKAILRRT